MHWGIITLWSLNPTFHFTSQQNTCSLSTQCICITSNEACVNSWVEAMREPIETNVSQLLLWGFNSFTHACSVKLYMSILVSWLIGQWSHGMSELCSQMFHRCCDALQYCQAFLCILHLDFFVSMHSSSFVNLLRCGTSPFPLCDVSVHPWLYREI